MNANISFYTFLGFLVVIAVVCLYQFHRINSRTMIRSKKNRFSSLKSSISMSVHDASLSESFSKAGLKLTSYKYQMFRYSIFLLWITAELILILNARESSNLLIIILFFLISSPVQKIYRFRTPFSLILGQVRISYNNKKNVEIYQMVGQLKNLVITRKGNPPGSEFILNQLNKFTVILKPALNRMLSYWSLGKREEACQYFRDAVDTKEGEMLSDIFIKLDSMNPAELQNQILMLQDSVKSERGTARYKKMKMRSDIGYGVVIISVIMIFLNFMILSVYIDFMNQY